MQISMWSSYLYELSPDEKKRAEVMADLQRWCDLFAALGITAGVLHPGGGGLRAIGCEPEKIFACNVQALERPHNNLS